MPLTFGSCFAGIGGFDLGLERAGFRCLWQVEQDAACLRTLARHWPDVPRFTDVREVGREQLEPVDVVVGGFPCQDLSVAGKRAGLAGQRSGLFFELARIVAEVSARWLLAENVPGLLSSVCPCPGDGRCEQAIWDLGKNDYRCDPESVHACYGHDGGCDGGCMQAHGGAMGTVLGTLAELGHGFSYRVLDARYFGLAQRRERVFIVSRLGEPWSAPAAVLLEPDCCERDPASRRKAGAHVAGTIGSSPAGSGARTDLDRAGAFVEGIRGEDVAHAVSAGGGGSKYGSGRDGQDDFVVAPITTDPYGDAAAEESKLVAATLTAGVARGEGVREPGRRREDDDNLVVAYAQQGTNVGPMGALRRSHNETDGVPFVVGVDLQNTRIGGDIAGTLDTTRPTRGGGQAVMVASTLVSPGQQWNSEQSLPNLVAGFDLRQITSDANRSTCEPGSPQPTLSADSKSAVACFAVAPESGQGTDIRASEVDVAPAIGASSYGEQTDRQVMVATATVRRLTPKECERLQGFPDDWTAGESDSARYRMLGNAVPPPMVEWLARRLRAEHERIEGGST